MSRNHIYIYVSHVYFLFYLIKVTKRKREREDFFLRADSIISYLSIIIIIFEEGVSFVYVEGGVSGLFFISFRRFERKSAFLSLPPPHPL